MTEHFNLSREEWEAAAKARLDELDVTYCELSRMARYGIWASHRMHDGQMFLGPDGEPARTVLRRRWKAELPWPVAGEVEVG